MIQQDRSATAPTLPARAPGSQATPLPRVQRSAGFGQPFVQLLNPRHLLYSVPGAVDPASQPEQVVRRAELVTAVDSHSAPTACTISPPTRPSSQRSLDIELDDNVVQTFCHFDRFFASLAAADR
jgi:hypothetical protein